MAKKLVDCKYACPANSYDGHGVTPRAARNLSNNEMFREEAWKGEGVRTKGEWYPRRKAAGCLLKVFNDRKQLPKEEFPDDRVDITCVGPTSRRCPRKLRFSLVRIDNRELARKSSTG